MQHLLKTCKVTFHQEKLEEELGHLFAVASVLFIWFFTFIKWPTDYLSKHLTDYLK